MNIASAVVWGKPLFVWVGGLALIGFLFTASIPFLRRKGLISLSIDWHTRTAKAAILLALAHVILAIALFW